MRPGGGAEPGRAHRMARRLERELKRAGATPDARRSVLDAHRLAMEPRFARLDGEDPALLHPARTVIVLLSEVGLVEAEALAAAPLVESEVSGLRVDPERIEDQVGADAAAVVRAIPASGDPRLAERLVTAEPEVRAVALAERLDQLRHAHLWDDEGRLRSAHKEATEVYLPVAVRGHPGLERRFRWWCRKFSGR